MAFENGFTALSAFLDLPVSCQNMIWDFIEQNDGSKTGERLNEIIIGLNKYENETEKAVRLALQLYILEKGR